MPLDQQAVADLVQRVITHGQYFDQKRARTGKVVGPNQYVLRDGNMTDNEVYVRIDGLDAQPLVVKNVRVNGLVPDIPVKLKPVYPGSRELEIINLDVNLADKKFGPGTTAVSIPAISGDALALIGGLTVTSPMIRTFKGVKGSSGLNVKIYGGWHWNGFWATAELDLTAYRPATAGKQAWVLFGVDTITNTATAITGDEYEQGSELHYSIIGDIDTPKGFQASAAVVLTDTQTTIASNNDIQDARRLFNGVAEPLVLTAQVASTVLAGPTSGADALPTFRALTSTDISDFEEAVNAVGTIDNILTDTSGGVVVDANGNVVYGA